MTTITRKEVEQFVYELGRRYATQGKEIEALKAEIEALRDEITALRSAAPLRAVPTGRKAA